MVLVGMHAPGRDEAHEVACAACFFEGCDKVPHHFAACHRAIGQAGSDARQFLHDHAARADIEVADLGIAHLPARQANILATGLEEGAGAGRP